MVATANFGRNTARSKQRAFPRTVALRNSSSLPPAESKKESRISQIPDEHVMFLSIRIELTMIHLFLSLHSPPHSLAAHLPCKVMAVYEGQTTMYRTLEARERGTLTRSLSPRGNK
ncbi:hypothetical protein NL676_009815 [Syzygium grande]|nr:hypothetical protein NL676_009815 [Syzygium grande]